MNTTKKSVSDDLIVDRFLSRYGRGSYVTPRSFLPDQHLLYVRCEDALYVYENGAFVPFDDEHRLVMSLIDFLKGERDQFSPDPFDESLLPLHPEFDINMRKVRGIAEILRTKIALSNAVDTINSSFISFKNNVTVDVLKSPPQIHQSSPLLKCFTSLPVDYTPETQPPVRFLQFLNQILVDEVTKEPDPQLIAIVQEMFGYCLLPTISAQTAFFLIGSGANGKSTLLNVLSSFFDFKAISAIRLSDMTGSSFMLSELVGKQLNIVNEEESKYVRVDMLKHLISGEPVIAMRKYRSPISFVPKTKFLWATNDVPSFDKIDAALRRRLIFIPFHRSIPINERDPELTKKLKEELVPILFWALEGAKRLMENTFRFSRSISSESMTKSVRLDRFPSLEFIEEQYEITDFEDDVVATMNLYDRFRLWCDKNGFAKCSVKTFSKQIHDFDPRIKAVRKMVMGHQSMMKTNLKPRLDAEPIFSEYASSSSQEN
jgi:P4 family phage/plasmid primase-like protien